MVERTDDHPGTGSATYCSAVSLRQASRTLVLAQRSYANNATTSSCMKDLSWAGKGALPGPGRLVIQQRSNSVIRESRTHQFTRRGRCNGVASRETRMRPRSRCNAWFGRLHVGHASPRRQLLEPVDNPKSGPKLNPQPFFLGQPNLEHIASGKVQNANIFYADSLQFVNRPTSSSRNKFNVFVRRMDLEGHIESVRLEVVRRIYVTPRLVVFRKRWLGAEA